MTLFDLAKKNVARNLSRYALYVGTTIFSIVIYFTFSTLKHSDEISELAETSKQISGLMSTSTFILMIFVGLFITYSNAFFLRGRKREVGLYSLLGVRKRQIGLLLLFENVVIGAFSLFIGIGVGIIGANGLLQLLMRLMENEIVLGFSFSGSALAETFVVFLVIFLFTSFQGYRVIYRFKLIELFHAENKGEEVPQARGWVALLGVTTIGVAYWIALQDISTSKIWESLELVTPLVIIGLTVVGSALLFHSVLIFILNRLKNNVHWSWKRLNVLTTSQLLYRIRGNAKTLTLISIISATAITAGGAIFSLYYYADENMESYTPYTFAWKGESQQVEEAVLTSTVLEKTIFVDMGYGEFEYGVVDETTYHRLTAGIGAERVGLQSEEGVLMIDPFYDEQYSNDVGEIVIEGTTYEVEKRITTSPFNVRTFGITMFVVSDEVFRSIDGSTTAYQVVRVEDDHRQLLIQSERLSSLGLENFSSAPADYQETIAMHGALLFVGTFLGLVFLVATGSVIYFKTMTEAEEDRRKYEILQKVGVSKKDVSSTVRQQILFVFLAPFALGIAHASVALVAFSQLFNMNFTVPVLVWMGVYSSIYATYYVLTVRRFKSAVL